MCLSRIPLFPHRRTYRHERPPVGRALYYAPRAHALVVSRDGAPATALRLGDTSVRDIRGGYKLLARSIARLPEESADISLPGLALNSMPVASRTGAEDLNGEWCAYSAWLEWPETALGRMEYHGDVDSHRHLDVVGVMRCELAASKPGATRAATSVLLSSTKPAGRDAVVLVSRNADETSPLVREFDLGEASLHSDRAFASTSSQATSNRLSRKVLGTCLWQHSANKTSMLVLLDDGSLRLYVNNLREEKDACSPNTTDTRLQDREAQRVDDEGEADEEENEEDDRAFVDDDLSSSVVSSTMAALGVDSARQSATTDQKGAPPCTIFESLSLVQPGLINLEGELCGSASNDDVRRCLRSSNDDYIVSSRVDGGSGLLRVPKLDKLAAIRVLLGSASLEHLPTYLVVGGRWFRTLRQRRWYDVVLDEYDREHARRLGGVVISLVGSQRAGTLPILDAAEAYHYSHLKEGAPEAQLPSTLHRGSTSRAMSNPSCAMDRSKQAFNFLPKCLSVHSKKLVAPHLQRALFAAVKARAALACPPSIDGDGRQVHSSRETKCRTYDDEMHCFDFDSSRIVEDEQALLSDLRSVEEFFLRSSALQSLVTVATRLVEVTCLAGEKVKWPGIRAAAATLCSIICGFDRSASWRLVDSARFRRLQKCIGDERAIAQAPASVAFLALSLARSRRNAFFEVTMTQMGEKFLFARILSNSSLSNHLQSFGHNSHDLSVAIQIIVNLACCELDARASFSGNTSHQFAVIRSGFKLLQEVFESTDSDVADAATAMFAAWLACSVRATQSTDPVASPAGADDTEETETYVAGAKQVTLDADEKKVEDEQRESKDACPQAKPGAKFDHPSFTDDCNDVTASPMLGQIVAIIDIALPILLERMSQVVSAIADSHSTDPRLGLARVLVRYLSILLVAASTAADSTTSRISAFVAAQLRSILIVDLSHSRVPPGVLPGKNNHTTLFRHAWDMSTHDDIAWRGDDSASWFSFDNEADAVRADASVVLMKAIQHLCDRPVEDSVDVTPAHHRTDSRRVQTTPAAAKISASASGKETLRCQQVDEGEIAEGPPVSSPKRAARKISSSQELQKCLAASRAVAMELKSAKATYPNDCACNKDTLGVALLDAIVARYRRAIATLSNTSGDDYRKDDDENGDQELIDDIAYEDDEDAAFRRALLTGADSAVHKRSADPPHRLRKLLLKKDRNVASRSPIVSDPNFPNVLPPGAESVPETAMYCGIESYEGSVDAESAAVARLFTTSIAGWIPQFTNETALPGNKYEVPTNTREWWARFYLPSCLGEEDELVATQNELTRTETFSSDARAALAYVDGVVSVCAVLRGGFISWPAAFFAALCETTSRMSLPKQIRRTAKRALRRVCGGSSLEYRTVRDMYLYAGKAQLLRHATTKSVLDHSESVALEDGLLVLLSLSRKSPHSWRTFCSRSPLVAGSIDIRNSLAYNSDDEGCAPSSRIAHLRMEQDAAVCLLFELSLTLAEDSVALRLCLELLEVCMRPLTSKPASNDEVCEDARAEAESATRRVLEEGLSSSNSSAISHVLERAAQRRRFARFLGFGPPASLVEPGSASGRICDPCHRLPSRAAIALVNSALCQEQLDEDGLISKLAHFASRIVVDGVSRTIRESGASFLRHLYLVLPTNVRLSVFEMLAKKAPQEAFRSVGRRGVELLEVLTSFVHMSRAHADSVIMESLARDISRAVKSCSNAIEARKEILSVYNVTDALGLPRFFDCDSDGEYEDEVGETSSSRRVSQTHDDCNVQLPLQRRHRPLINPAVEAYGRPSQSSNREVGMGHFDELLSQTRTAVHVDCLPYYDSIESCVSEALGAPAFLFDDRGGRAQPYHCSYFTNYAEVSANAEHQPRDTRGYTFDAALSEDDDLAAEEYCIKKRKSMRKCASAQCSGKRDQRKLSLNSSFESAQAAMPAASSERKVRLRRQQLGLYNDSRAQITLANPRQPPAARHRINMMHLRSVSLEDMRKGARFTESCAIAQLREVRRIKEIELRVREARCRQPRRVRIHYSPRHVDNLASLAVPANWGEWKIAAELRLGRGKSDVVRHEFTPPLVAANLLFEYDDFYDVNAAHQSTASTGSSLPRRRCGIDDDDAEIVGRFLTSTSSCPPTLAPTPSARQCARGLASSTASTAVSQSRAGIPMAAMNRVAAIPGSALTKGAPLNYEGQGSAAHGGTSLSDIVFAATYRQAHSPRLEASKITSRTTGEDLSSETRGRGGTLHCPRCGRRVADAHGVCQHCGEVAFQCRQVSNSPNECPCHCAVLPAIEIFYIAALLDPAKCRHVLPLYHKN